MSRPDRDRSAKPAALRLAGGAEGGILNRKDQHLDIVLDGRTARYRQAATGFEAIAFEHCALPELDLDEIDLATPFLGRTLRAPFLISSMTGGPQRAAAINRHLAEAAEALGLALAVGSQRVALSGSGDGGVTRELRRLAPTVPLLANLGGAQIVDEYGLDEARRAVEMIDADALIIHLNPLQEILQPEGDRRWRGALAAIERLVVALDVPIVVKEVGCGLSAAVARRLSGVGVDILDVAGAGGTSWAAIEGERAGTEHQRRVAAAFSDWGIPTAVAIRAVRDAVPGAVVIGSGGIRTGLDAAKAIALGADLVGQAAAVLDGAVTSTEAVVAHFRILHDQLRAACFCTASPTPAALRQARLLAG